MLAGTAPAQLLEPLRPVLEPVLQPTREIVTGVTGPGATVLQPLATEARQLLRLHPGQLETDRRGLPIMRAVIVALSPDPDALARALERGYLIQDDQQLEGIGQRLVTLLVPRGTGTREALRDLREADPDGQYDFDHLYMESGAAPAPAPPGAAMPEVQRVDIRVGLIDGGVDVAHPVFRRAPPTVSGCGGNSRASAHGTAVASLFVGWSADFAGAAPGAQLLAIDVYCGGDAPGGRMRDVVAALSALAEEQARVVNMSIVGPDNAVLAATVRAVQSRSVLIVAATGNDGPNAKPLYPAAYPGVIAVSAVDANLRVLPEASGGAHVSFSAPGADLLAAAPEGKFQTVRGTSFAAPLVAGMLAQHLASDDSDTQAIVRRLAAAAEDRGRKGRDNRYGFGLVGADLPQRGLMAHPGQ
jgi:subtilisin family serine protease